ncbi:MAG: oxidoreductase [Flavobacterium sp. BFFFF2]|nr:MAG: oxidoreductase [Flavobacterium sp. BFFFF2]
MSYDVAIIGGGIAGLSLSIDLKKRGHQVIVIEKGTYPRHKVCGEYISMESHHYLQQLCPALAAIHLPMINQFKLTTGSSKAFTTALDLGGFGISRYLLEELLFHEAKNQGVVFMLNKKALDIHFDVHQNKYAIQTSSSAVHAALVCNATGRKSNLKTAGAKRIDTNYVGIKYHIKMPRNPNLIEIHNFPGGYCGISNIEEDKSCLCYMVNAKYLQKGQHAITELEKTNLFKNSHLEEVFTTADFLFKQPVTVSGINFLIKQPVSDECFFLGDAAGSMAPITGNGMSMALRSASVLAQHFDQFFLKEISKQQLVAKYTQFWNQEFSTRINLSRHLQRLSESSFLANRTIELCNAFPSLAKGLINQTHGKPF